MKKKVLVLLTAACLAASMVGCSTAKTQKQEAPVADSSTQDNNQDNMEAEMPEDIVTEGTFKAQELDSDVTKATFTGADGDFVAIISADTEMPEGDLVEGKKYKIHHKDMEAMSNPPQFTNVTKIEAAE